MKQAGWSSLGLCDEYDHLESFILFGHVLGEFKLFFCVAEKHMIAGQISMGVKSQVVFYLKSPGSFFNVQTPKLC